MAAAVVELDSLADPVRAAAEDNDPFLFGLRRRFVFVFVRGVIVGRIRLEFGGARVDRLERGDDPPALPLGPDVHFRHVPNRRQLAVGEAVLFGFLQREVVDRANVAKARQLFFELDDLDQVIEKPRVDTGQIVDLVDRHTFFNGVSEIPDALRSRDGQFGANIVLARLFARSPQVLAVASKAETADFQAPQRLLERFLERPPDGHRLADALHLRGQDRIGFREFLEGKTRNLRNDVVDRRLEAGDRLLRNVVGQFVQAVADGQFRRNLRDGKSGRLRRQGARAAHPRVHLDDDHPAVLRMNGELDVRTARLDADLANDGERSVAHPLVFFVGESLRRSDRDRVARVDPHGVEVLDGTDDDAVVVAVAHHLHFEFFPAEDRFLEQNLVDRRLAQAPGDEFLEFIHIVGDARTASTECEARPDDARQADSFDDLSRFLKRFDCLAAADFEADLLHRRLELLAIFRLVDDVGRRRQHLDPVFLQDAVGRQVHRQVQARLPAQRREQRVRPLLFDDLRDHLPVQRLDVGPIRHLGVGHNRGRVRVDQRDLVPLLSKGLARLRTRIVEFARLTDNDGSGSDEQDLVNIVASGH